MDSNTSWRKKHVRLLEQNYGRHPKFFQLKEVLQAIADPTIEDIAELNIIIIKAFCSIIGNNFPYYRSSELDIIGQRSDRLIAICKNFGCDTYLSPIGAKEYLTNDNAFRKSNVKLRFQDYIPKEYPQKGSLQFISYLSFFDVVANIGVEEAKEYIKNGIQKINIETKDFDLQH